MDNRVPRRKLIPGTQNKEIGIPTASRWKLVHIENRVSDFPID